MSQPSSFGPPVHDDPTGEVPAPATTDGPPEKKTRVGLLAVAGVGVVAGAAVIGFLLMSGTSDDDLGYTGPIAAAPEASTTASPSTSPTPLPTESTVNARNPFLAPPKASPAGGAGARTTQAPNPGAPQATAPAATPGTAPTTAPTTTTEPVLVTLTDYNADTGKAKFKVLFKKATTAWTVLPGARFGKPLSTDMAKPPFFYDGVAERTSGQECPNVRFVDAPVVQVCKGEIIQVQ